MKWSSITRHRAGTTFVLIFFIVFAVLGSFLVADSMRVYYGISNRAATTHMHAMPFDYLAGVVRRADTAGGLDIVTLADGTTALSATEQGKTWLYFCRDGYLYKQNARKSKNSAERLCTAGSMRLRWNLGLIRADYTAPDGSKKILLLSPRTISAGGVS